MTNHTFKMLLHQFKTHVTKLITALPKSLLQRQKPTIYLSINAQYKTAGTCLHSVDIRHKICLNRLIVTMTMRRVVHFIPQARVRQKVGKSLERKSR